MKNDSLHVLISEGKTFKAKIETITKIICLQVILLSEIHSYIYIFFHESSTEQLHKAT